MDSLDSSLSIPQFRLSEIGYSGLRVVDGRLYEEDDRELLFPNCVKLYKRMSKDPVIAAGLGVFEMFISRAEPLVDDGGDKTIAMKRKVAFLNEVFGDMEVPLKQVIRESTSQLKYGFHVAEKVFRKRTLKAGSKYEDNKIGIKRIVTRPQDSIKRWVFSADGRELTGVVQDTSWIIDKARFNKLITDNPNGIVIPRSKFMLFRVNPIKDSPEGNSPLKSCVDAWKTRVNLEAQESVGVSRDMNGMPLMWIPPKYMSDEATDADKRTYEQFKSLLRNIHNNEQSSMILPLLYDPESREPLFKFQLMSTEGGKMYDIDKVVKRYDNKILMCLFADALKMGQDQVGSYALAGEKTNLMVMAIEARLTEIADVFNTDLIPQLFELNGFPKNEPLPKLKFGRIAPIDLDEFSKAIQRLMSTSSIEFDRPVANLVREAIGVKPKPDDEEIDWDSIPAFTSRSGDGMATAGEGTSTNPSGNDTSTSNKENA